MKALILSLEKASSHHNDSNLPHLSAFWPISRENRGTITTAAGGDGHRSEHLLQMALVCTGRVCDSEVPRGRSHRGSFRFTVAVADLKY